MYFRGIVDFKSLIYINLPLKRAQYQVCTTKLQFLFLWEKNKNDQLLARILKKPDVMRKNCFRFVTLWLIPNEKISRCAKSISTFKICWIVLYGLIDDSSFIFTFENNCTNKYRHIYSGSRSYISYSKLCHVQNEVHYFNDRTCYVS